MNKVWIKALIMGSFVMFAGINAVQNDQQDDQRIRAFNGTREAHSSLLTAARQKGRFISLSAESLGIEMIEPVVFQNVADQDVYCLPAAVVRDILKNYEEQVQTFRDKNPEHESEFGLFSVPPQSYIDARKKGLVSCQNGLVILTGQMPDGKDFVIDKDIAAMGGDLFIEAVEYYRFIHNLDGEDNEEVLKNRAEFKAAIELGNAQAITEASARPLYWNELRIAPAERSELCNRISILQAAIKTRGFVSLADVQAEAAQDAIINKLGLNEEEVEHNKNRVCVRNCDFPQFPYKYETNSGLRISGEVGLAISFFRYMKEGFVENNTDNVCVDFFKETLKNKEIFINKLYIESVESFIDFFRNRINEQDPCIAQNRRDLLGAIISADEKAIIAASAKPLHVEDLK